MLATKALSLSMNLLGRWKRRDLAERLAAAYCKWHPGDPFGWGIWGKVLKNLKRTEDAEKALRVGLALHPHDPNITWQLAEVLRWRGADMEAETLLKDSMKARPDSYVPYLGLVELGLWRGLTEEALMWADKVEERIGPEEFGKMFDLALPLGIANHPETRRRAISLLERATAGWPRFPLAHALLGLLLEGEDNDGAERHLAKAKLQWKGHHSFDDFVLIQRKAFKNSANGKLHDNN